MSTAILKTVLLLSIPLAVLADEDLKTEYLNHDLSGTALIRKLMPLETQTFESITLALADRYVNDDQDLGFGGRTFTIFKGNGYTSLYFEGFTFNGRLGRFKVGVHGLAPSWPLIRERVMKSWRDGGGPEFECDDTGCFHESSDERIIQSYKDAVRAQLGEISQVAIPKGLERYYQYLMSPFEITRIGRGGCGLPPQLLPGREAIDVLLSQRRVDLITNVLRGYNPRGRVYALIALRSIRREGVPLPLETRVLMTKVRNLAVRVSTCVGCIVNNGMIARDVIREY